MLKIKEFNQKETMQRIFTAVKSIVTISRIQSIQPSAPNTFLQFNRENLLQTNVPSLTQVCGFKVKGRVRRRCKDCYMVVRDERLFVICPKHPRHKQMAMKPKPLNTWILTHASQSKVRPW